jgi:hypothetical protein
MYIYIQGDVIGKRTASEVKAAEISRFIRDAHPQIQQLIFHVSPIPPHALDVDQCGTGSTTGLGATTLMDKDNTSWLGGADEDQSGNDFEQSVWGACWDHTSQSPKRMDMERVILTAFNHESKSAGKDNFYGIFVRFTRENC